LDSSPPICNRMRRNTLPTPPDSDRSLTALNQQRIDGLGLPILRFRQCVRMQPQRVTAGFPCAALRNTSAGDGFCSRAEK